MCVRSKVLLTLAAGVLLGGLVLAAHRASSGAPVPLTPEEQEVKSAITALWQAEDNAVMAGDTSALPVLFDLTTSTGEASLKQARERLSFVQAWARGRGVQWTGVHVAVRTPAIRLSGKTATVSAWIAEEWTYAYLLVPSARQTFGLGQRHWMRVTQTPNGWRIVYDWFTDPLDQDTRIPGGVAIPTAASVPTVASNVPLPPPLLARAQPYNGPGTVAYADAYCGIAPGCGNGNRYNPRFYDYNGEGGDCTNFVSQALAVGGGLVRNGTWNIDPNTREGTVAWGRAGGLVAYLTGTGLAQVLARGSYAAVTTAPAGGAAPIARLVPGDVLAYYERGRIVHLAIVVGRDPVGVVLVDSHTADRYHVPWDIGWDRTTTFVLLHFIHTAPVASLPPAEAQLLAQPYRGSGC